MRPILSGAILVGVGFALGIICNRFLAPSPSVEEKPREAEIAGIEDRNDEFAAAKVKIAALEGEIARLKATATRADSAGATPVPPSAPTESPNEPDRTGREEAPSPNRTAWRISAIEKFVPLSEEQRQRLTVKFERDAQGEEASESLEDILGTESAAFYRTQVKAAFERARNEAVDREIVWLGRQLALNAQQERDIKAAFDAVELELDTNELPDSVKATTGEERVKAMIAENKRREELRQERLKAILTPDQLIAYMRVQAESSQSDIEVFHGAE